MTRDACISLEPSVWRARAHTTASRDRVGSTIASLAFKPLKAVGRSTDGFDFCGTRTKKQNLRTWTWTGAGRVGGVGFSSPSEGCRCARRS